MVERVMILRESGDIVGEDLPPQFHAPQTGANGSSDGNERQSLAPLISSDGISFNDVIGDLETDLILQALEQTHWNKNQAAQLLGLNRTTLLEKIKKKGLEPRSS
jgi:DNA-binding NtrC family response regulator